MTERKCFVFKFADVEVREREFLLIKAGERVPIEPKAFRVLLYLLRNPGRLIPKDEIVGSVWNDSAVSDNSLTRSIAQLRRVLADDSREPLYILTVPTVGYRFLCEVASQEDGFGMSGPNPCLPISGTATESALKPDGDGDNSLRNPATVWSNPAVDSEKKSPKPPIGDSARFRRLFLAVLAISIALIAVILLAVVTYFPIANRSSGPRLRISEYTQLTHDGHAGTAMGTDGSRLYLQNFPVASISEVSVSGGQIEPVLSVPVQDPLLRDVSPDGSTFLVQSFRQGPDSLRLYAVQVVGGSDRYIADAVSAGWSPDGKRAAYSTPNGDLNVINSDGTGVRKLASVGGVAIAIAWSPDGRTIRFVKDKSFWEVASNGADLHPSLAGWNPSEEECCGHWSPDGSFFAFLGPGPAGPNSQIYALDERRGIFRRGTHEPFQLTSGPIDWDVPIFSKDGKKIFATGSTHVGQLMRLDPKSNQFQPFLGGISADLVAFSKDGQSVAYVSYPDGVLWRTKRDGSGRIQLTTRPLQPVSLAWSPNGSQLALMADSPKGTHTWIVPAEGGSPKRLLPNDSGEEKDPSWSPDGSRIIFATGGLGNSESSIRILDLASHRITTLPGSEGKYSPRYSPDGHFIKADSFDNLTLYLFDLKTQRWSTLNKGIQFAYATWSSDSRYLYFLRFAHDPAILRIPVAGGEAKVVVELKGFPFTGTLSLWFGLDPTDAPLMLRDASTTDVYALTLEEK